MKSVMELRWDDGIMGSGLRGALTHPSYLQEFLVLATSIWLGFILIVYLHRRFPQWVANFYTVLWTVIAVFWTITIALIYFAVFLEFFTTIGRAYDQVF